MMMLHLIATASASEENFLTLQAGKQFEAVKTKNIIN